MSYNTAIPQVSDFIIQSAPQLRANYTQIQNSFSQDHYPINDPNQGMHRSLTLRNQMSDPVTGVDQVAIYNKTGTGSLPQLFYAPNSAQTPIQLSYQSIVNTGLQQYSFIAGPFIFFFGYLNPVTDGQVVTLSPATTLISVILTEGSNKVIPSGIDVQPPFQVAATISGASFTINMVPVTDPSIFISYTAIGLVT